MASRREAPTIEASPDSPPSAELAGAGVKTPRWQLIAAYLACGIAWGTSFCVIRASIGPGAFPTIASAALRYGFSAVLVFLIILLRFAPWKRPSPSALFWVTIAGAFNAIGGCAVYMSEEKISGGLAAVLCATSPLLTVLIAALTGTEGIARKSLFGMLVAFLGVALVFHDRLMIAPDSAWAVVCALLASLFYACSNTTLKRHSPSLHPMVTSLILFSATSIVVAGIAAVFERKAVLWPVPIFPSLCLAYLVIVATVIATILFFFLLKRVRLDVVMTLVFVQPMVSLLIDAFFEHSVKLSVETYGGISLVALGVLLSVGMSQLARSRRAVTIENRVGAGRGD